LAEFTATYAVFYKTILWHYWVAVNVISSR